MGERRRFERFDRNLVAYYRRLDSEEFALAALTKDVSLGGILLELDETCVNDTCVIGDTIEAEIVLAESEPPVQLIGRVVRKSEDGTGLEFVRISEADRARISAYVSRRAAARCA